MLCLSVFFNINKNGIIDIKVGGTMLEQIINSFYFERSLYIVIVVLFAFFFINDLKKKDKISLNKYLVIKNINIYVLFKYLFLSFIIRIILEQIVAYLPFTETNIQIPSTMFEIVVQFITTCIFAPVFEEIIFRFGIYKKINKKLNIIVSMIITSMIFSIMHFYNIDGCVILIVVSLVWNYSFYKTDNLVYPILLHFFHNIYALSDNLFKYSNYWYILLFINILGYIILIKKQKN